MARPQKTTVTVSYVAGRLKPWKAEYRALNPATGKRDRIREFFETELAANAFKTGFESETAHPPADAPVGGITFRHHAEDWLQTVVRRRSAGTQLKYESILRLHVLPHWGDLLVSPATMKFTTVVDVVRKAADAGASWNTQLAILAVIKSCLGYAMIKELLSANPAAGVARFVKDATVADPEPNPLTAAQMTAFLHWLQMGTLPSGFQRPASDVVVDIDRPRTLPWTPGLAYWYPFFLTLCLTGMRCNEATALRWPSVHLDGLGGTGEPLVCIERTQSRAARRLAAAGDTRFDRSGDVAPKTKRSRTINLPPELVDLWRSWQGRATSRYVFVRPNGQRLSSQLSHLRRILAAGMAAIGARDEGHTIHDLRDTFATTHLLQDFRRVQWVSWMLGHASIAMTLTRYTTWIPQQLGAQYADSLPRTRVTPADPEGPAPRRRKSGLRIVDKPS